MSATWQTHGLAVPFLSQPRAGACDMGALATRYRSRDAWGRGLARSTLSSTLSAGNNWRWREVRGHE